MDKFLLDLSRRWSNISDLFKKTLASSSGLAGWLVKEQLTGCRDRETALSWTCISSAIFCLLLSLNLAFFRLIHCGTLRGESRVWEQR